MIKDNVIKWTKKFSVYLLKSTDVTIENNLCAQAQRFIFLDINCTNNIIQNNNLFSVFPNISEHAIVIENSSIDNIAESNNISGTYTSSTTTDISGLNNVNNNYNRYHTYNEEMLILD